MARLIIGHVTPNSVTIWVRGDKKHSVAFIQVDPGNKLTVLSLEERHGFTGAVDITGLKNDTDYLCEVEFAASRNVSRNLRVDYGHCRGKFKTAPAADANPPFKFLLGSCNLHSLGIVTSPDRAYEELLERSAKNDVRFMIHCGDQIYYDIPNPRKRPDINEYRDKYLDAWGDSRPTRKFLTQIPHYMIMDDHEITNNFANDMKPPDGNSTPELYRMISMKVYREFVHIRQPDTFGNQALYYSYSYGGAQFFIMDCRTERFGFTAGAEQIVSDAQMTDFKKWLSRHKNDLKFVVSSVPFVMEVANDDDKWGAPAFAAQRNEVIDHLMKNEIGRLVFLTGDMHASYHAKMTIDGDHEVHELMSSPINQLQKSALDRFRQGVVRETTKGHKYSGRIMKFYSKHSNAMLIEVDQEEVSYEIFRTKKTRKVRSGSFTP
jgi:alkaline phosphatase D